MTLRETLSQGINGRGVTAEVYYDEGPEVEVKIIGNGGYGAQSYWRVTGTKSAGDYDTHYIKQTDADSGTFEAENGHEYALQAIWGSPGISNGAFFTVNFGDGDDDEGGSSGGGSGGSSGQYKLYITEGEGTYIWKQRTWNQATQSDGYNETITNGTTIVWGDYIRFYVEPEEGYQNAKIELINFSYFQSPYVDEYGHTIHWGTMASHGDINVRSWADLKQYTLSISNVNNLTATVTRVYSRNKNASLNTPLKNGDIIYHHDQLSVSFTPNTGYNVSTHTINGIEFSNDATHTVTGNTSIVFGTDVKSYSLTLNPDTGVTINVSRTSSPLKGAENKTFTSSEQVTYENEIYYNDKLTITFLSSPEYKISQQLVNQEFFISGSSHTVIDDVEVTAITELSGLAHIFNGNEFDDYVVYIFNGQDWNDQYIPHIFDGTNWVICS